MTSPQMPHSKAALPFHRAGIVTLGGSSDGGALERLRLGPLSSAALPRTASRCQIRNFFPCVSLGFHRHSPAVPTLQPGYSSWRTLR